MLDFIRRERIYILILLFILALNVLNAGRVKKEPYVEKKPLSTMTFTEMGITEERVKNFFDSETPSTKFFKYSIFLGFLVFVASFIFNIVFIFQGKRIDLDALPYRRPVQWGISDLVRVSIIIIFLSYVIAIAESFIFKLFNLNIGLNLRMISSTFFIDIAVGMVILYFVMVKYKERLRELGLKVESFFKNIASGIAAYILILPVLLVILFLSVWILNLLGYSPPPQPVFEVFMEEKRSRVLFFLAIFVSIFGPIVEEMFFRGFMYGAIKKHLGVIGAAFFSACIFSLLHTNIVGFLPIMALGLVLAYLYERTGSLIASMTVHILHNSIVIGFVFFIKGLMG